MGDFNTYLGSAEINELLSNTHLSCKYKDKKAGFANTNPSVRPKRALDYVLTSEGVNVKRYVVLNFRYSDHLPVLVDFELE
jgi:endonuclease/exonuclease/phosphatase family metal-dependent hydrolase